MSSVNDVFAYSGLSGSGTEDFVLRGGNYSVAVAAGSWGTIALNVLAADNTTYVPYETWSANTATSLNLTAGSYQFDYGTLTTGSASICQQPNLNWVPTASLPLPISVSGSSTVVTVMPATTELDLIGDSDGAWVYSVDVTGSDTSGSAGAGSGTAVDGDSGSGWLYSGNVSGSGASGVINILSGNSSGGDSGNINLTTGTANGTRGTLQLDTGSVVGVNGVLVVTPDNGSGNSLSIVLQTGTASGTRGNITLDALHVLVLNLPTSASGLATGTLWNSTGTLKVA